jgi:hypothetical protein
MFSSGTVKIIAFVQGPKEVKSILISVGLPDFESLVQLNTTG